MRYKVSSGAVITILLHQFDHFVDVITDYILPVCAVLRGILANGRHVFERL